MKNPLPTEDLRYDMSQFYPLKAALETLLGHRVYLRLKETATLRDWKDEVQKLLCAIGVAVKSTVEIAEGDWFEEIDSTLKRGQNYVAASKSVTALFAHLAATLAELVFIQLGFLPLGRQSKETIPLTKGWWTLNSVRSVQYVQNNNQRHTAQELRDKRNKGSPEVMSRLR